jgi:periplasmic divalent cation tolerance protein
MYCIAITTCANEADAKEIANAVLSARLAACVQIMPIRSHYTWKGAVVEEPENLLLMKTKTALYSDLESCVRKHHRYEVPEIIMLAIGSGAQSYFSWIDEVTRE